MAQLWGGEGVALLSKAKLGHLLRCSQASARLQGSQGLSRQMHTHCKTGLPCQGCQPEAGGGLILPMATEIKLRPCKTGPWPPPGERAGGPHTTVLQRPGPHVGSVKDRAGDMGSTAATCLWPSWRQVLHTSEPPGQLCPSLLSRWSSRPGADPAPG